MSIFRHYLTLVLFAAGLLLGLQAPNFVDQYETKIDEHLADSRAQLVGYFRTADHFGEGDIQGSMPQQTRSGNETEISDRQSIRKRYERLQRLELEKDALRSPLVGKVLHIILFAESVVLGETIREYSASVPLTAPAIFSGLLGGLVVCIIFELVYGAAMMVLKRLQERKAMRGEQKQSIRPKGLEEPNP